jgi:hypothetical protein
MEQAGLIRVADGKQLREKEQALIKVALAELKVAKEKGKSYFDQVPFQYRGHVHSLASENFPSFSDKFRSFEDFLEAISCNWLAKVAIFDKLAEAAGFTQAQGLGDIPMMDRDKYATALLTRSASFLLVGTGAFNAKGSGAAYQYTKIDLREDGPQNTTSDNGGRFENVPMVGDRVTLVDAFSTSPIVRMHRKRMDGNADVAKRAVEDVSRIMTRSFIDIDHQTIAREVIGPEKKG